MTKAILKSGFVALLGRPNSGKSTLVNSVLGTELSVVTPLPQTTRRAIRGVYTSGDMQIVFIDTPGIHRGKYAFNNAMIREARGLFDKSGVDCVAYLVDLSRDSGQEEELVASIAAAAGVPVVIVFNKLDKCNNPEKKKSCFLRRFPAFDGAPSIAISATSPSSKIKFIAAVAPFIKTGPHLYDPDDLTDATMRFFAAEFIRKHIILSTQKEVPHAVFVEIEDYRETGKMHRISAVIHVETTGQKGIIIGRGGALITKVRKAAEKDLARLAGCQVSISTHLKVTPDWRDNANFLSAAGMRIR